MLPKPSEGGFDSSCYEVYHNQGMPLESNMRAHLFVCVFLLGSIIFAI